MSLINKMLRDLDARQASSADRSALPEVLNGPPRESERRQVRPALVAVAVVVAAVAAFQLLSPAGPQGPAVARYVPAPVPRTAPPVAPPVAVVAPALPAPPAVERRAEAPKPKADAGPDVRPAPKPTVEKPGRPLQALPAPKPAPAPASSAPPAPPARAPAPMADAAGGAIEKRPLTPLHHEAAEAEYRKGMTALRRGATSDAGAGFRLALELERRHVSARQALLSVLVENQQWGEAQALVEEGLAVDPTQAGWAMALARLQLERGNLAAAGETLARHAAHAERHADYLAFHAVVLQRQKRHAEAAERYRAALALRSGEGRWWYGLGLALEAEDKMPEARAAFQHAHDAGNLPPELLASVNQRLRLP